jgi:regulator of protease activity HflC (stomatin/prohibitin superfamily)
VDGIAGVIAFVILVLFLIFVLGSAVKVIRQQKVGVVERLGKYRRLLEPGPHLLVPVVDKVRYNIDMREAVVPFPPQGVITEDNLMVNIDSVIYFQVIDPVRAAYEAQDYIRAIEQLTMTTLRNIIGGLDLEQALTSREEINQKLRVVLDEATGKWGIKVNRVELRAIEPPATIRDAMEKGARAEREKRAQILLAEGHRQSQILGAGGEKESAILRAQGDREAAVLRAQADRQAQMLRAEGEAQAIGTVFNAIHAGQPDQALLAYQYMQMLPSIAKGDANKVWIVPSELNKALEGLGGAVSSVASAIPGAAKGDFVAAPKIDVQAEIDTQNAAEKEAADKTVQAAIEAAQQLEKPGGMVKPMPALRGDPAELESAPAQTGDNGYGSELPAAAVGAEPTDAAPADFSPTDEPAEPQPQSR